MMKERVSIYCRLSEEDRNKLSESDDSNSIQNQKNMLMQYAMEQGWDIYQIYSDDDYTGSDRNRPAFRQLIADAEEKKFDIVLCKTQSRFTRELELVEKYIHGLFPILGIRFVGLVDNADTANKGNKKSRQINGLVNEWYLEDMSENIRSVLINRRENGHHIGAFALYGYQKDPDKKGHLIIDPESAQIVREVFTLFSQGHGKTVIARMLNLREIPNPTEYKHLHGLRYQQPKGKHSTLWKYFSIANMLQNELYIGNMVQGKYGSVSYKTKINKPRPKEDWIRVEHTHEAIISPELWNDVQSLLAAKAKPFVSGEIGLFARKAQCAHCGYTLRSSKNRGRHYLQCPSRHVSKDTCIGSFVSVQVLEELVLNELQRLANDYLDQDEVARKVEFTDRLKDLRVAQLNAIDIFQKKIKERHHYIRTLYIDKVKGVITEEDYLQFSADFNTEREQLERDLADSREKLDTLDAQLLVGDQRRILLEQYLNPQTLTREMVELLVDHVVVSKREVKEKYPKIEIHWNF